MAYELRDMSGSVFPNDRKESDKHPDFTGKGMVNGQKVWISLWVKQSNNGEFFSLAFKPMDEQQAPRGYDDQRRQQSRPAQQRSYGQRPQPRRDDLDLDREAQDVF